MLFFLYQQLKLLSIFLSSSNLVFKLILKLGELGVQKIPDLHCDASDQSSLFVHETDFGIVFFRHALASFNTALHQI